MWKNDPEFVGFLEDQRRRRLTSYTSTPKDVREHHGIELNARNGGYRDRQIYELIQNAADAVREAELGGDSKSVDPGRIELLLKDECLYVANTGAPLKQRGIETLLMSHDSWKRDHIGRFGIGFKSVLSISSRPQIFSSNICLEFDGERSKRRIQGEVGRGFDHYPVMRLAWSIEPNKWRQKDPVLKKLEDWATTVVRLPLNCDQERAIERIQEEFREFPGQFLLFAETSLRLKFVDTGKDWERQVSVSHFADSGRVELQDPEAERGEQFWQVCQKIVGKEELSEEALQNAGDLHQRDEIPISWAVPLDGSSLKSGKFWNFFPLNDKSRIPGIVNAPWKTGNDRQSILEGPFNRSLLRAAAQLVVDSIDEVHDPSNPGLVAQLFPRRDGGRKEIAGVHAEDIWEELVEECVVPDCTGSLRRVDALLRPPTNDESILELWLDQAGAEVKIRYVHLAVLSGREEKARYETLVEKAGYEEAVWAEPVDWVEEVVADDPSASQVAIQLAADLLEETAAFLEKDGQFPFGGAEESKLRDAKIVLAEDGRLAAAQELMLPPEEDAPEACEGVDEPRYVHSALRADPKTVQRLKSTFGVEQFSPPDRVERLVDALKKTRKEYDKRWIHGDEEPGEGVWSFLRTLPDELYEDVFKKRARARWIPIRRMDGEWVDIQRIERDTVPLRVGELFEPELARHPENKRFFVDHEYHRDDGALLDLLSVPKVPRSVPFPEFDPEYGVCIGTIESAAKTPHYHPDFILSPLVSTWHDKFIKACRDAGETRRPREKKIRIVAGSRGYSVRDVEWYPTAQLLKEGSEELRATLTEWFARQDLRWNNPLRLKHSSEHQGYNDYPEEVYLTHPMAWAIWEYGLVTVEGHRLSVPEFMRARSDGLAYLPDGTETSENNSLWDFFANESSRFEIPDWSDFDSDDGIWEFAFEAVGNGDIPSEVVRRVYDTAARCGRVPDIVRLDGDAVLLDELYVSDDSEIVSRLDSPILQVSEEAAKAFQAEGATRVEPSFHVVGGEGPGEPFSDVFPALDRLFGDLDAGGKVVRELRVVICEGLVQQALQEEFPQDVHLDADAGRLLVNRSQVENLKSPDFQRRLYRRLADHEGTGEPVGDFEERFWEVRRDLRFAAVRAKPDRQSRIVEAVEEKPERLISLFPDSFSAEIEKRDIDVQDLATLVLDTFGRSSLKKLRPALREAGFEPPKRWTNGQRTLGFVRKLGFDDSFAGTPAERREDEETVVAAPELGELHSFQRDVYDQLGGILEAPPGERRGMVGLPTGSGKTRVTVQALVEFLLAKDCDEEPAPTVLWVAHRDELCEQAIECFQQVWRAKGPGGTPLKTGRLWSGLGTGLRPDDEIPQVVVTTNLTLANKFQSPEWEWLGRAGAVVIDEAHRGTARTYTSLLHRCGEQVPVIGLTATPFRNRDEDETRQLVNRFGGRRIPSEKTIPALYEQLRERRILSSVEQETLETAVDVHFTREERENLENYSFFRAHFPERASQRLGRNEERNELIMEKLVDRARDEKILFFANSVEHSQNIALRLNLSDIPARSIVGETAESLRRRSVELFKQGELRVLTNYQVLSVGFDAPKVDTIMIARPTFSHILYQQMIGRGIRGPKNGGTETCRLINVQDNYNEYGDRIAFDNFRYLWE